MLLFPLQTSSHDAHVNAHAHAHQHSKITWIIEDTQEWQSYIDKTPTTTSNETALIIINGLVDLGYRLNFVKATGNRAEKILRNEDNACIADRIKTPSREEFSLFSEPHDLYLGQKLYRVAQSDPLSSNILNSKGELLSLAHLFNLNAEKILAIGSAVSYGIELDRQIAELNKQNIFIRSGGNRIASLAKMLFKSRVDYIIYYPQEINALNLNNIELDSYTIAGSPAYFLGHVACAKTETGEHIIQHINEILQQAYKTRDFYYAHERWLGTGDLPKLRQYFFEVFKYLPNGEESKR